MDKSITLVEEPQRKYGSSIIAYFLKEHSLVQVVSKPVSAPVMSNRLCKIKGGKCDQVSKRERKKYQGQDVFQERAEIYL